MLIIDGNSGSVSIPNSDVQELVIDLGTEEYRGLLIECDGPVLFSDHPLFQPHGGKFNWTTVSGSGVTQNAYTEISGSKIFSLHGWRGQIRCRVTNSSGAARKISIYLLK